GFGAEISFQKVTTSGEIQGTDPAYSDAMGWKVDHGRFLQPSDIKDRTRVCVLGKTVAEDLFGTAIDPLDQLIHINGERYRVIGIMTEKRMFGDDWGQNIMVPVTTVQ